MAPHRTAPHRTAPHRTAPHRTAPHRTAPHRTAPHRTPQLNAIAQKPTPTRLALAGLLLLTLGLPATPTLAATATTTFAVTANVLARCRISAVPLAFGNYDPDSTTANDATSNITVRCNNGKTYDVGLNAGTFASATVTTRRMTGPDAAGLAYALYQEAGRTTNWGNTVDTDTVSGTGVGTPQTLTVYGRIPAEQFVTDGAYTDTITATITF